MQLKRHSVLEAGTNLAVGYSINFAANILIFPLFGWHISVAQNLELGVIYTIISMARQYVLRRFFTHWTENGEKAKLTFLRKMPLKNGRGVKGGSLYY